MIEFVYRENTREPGPERKADLPKNVRQVGELEGKRRIYIEDYVVTYLKHFAEEESLSSRIAVLLGQTERADGIPCLLIRGAAGVKSLEYTDRGIPFTDEAWAEIYGVMKEYFADMDILGWFLSLPGYPVELGPEVEKTHVNYFGGVDKVLLAAEPTDGEADFYAYENGRLTRQRGYYIFYERNGSMQRYMIETGKGESVDQKEDFDDHAIRSFRALVQEKKELSGQKRVLTFLYAASTFLVMVVLVIGITLINNYEKMKGLETTLGEISRSLENQSAGESSDTALMAAYADGGSAEEKPEEGDGQAEDGNSDEIAGENGEEKDNDAGTEAGEPATGTGETVEASGESAAREETSTEADSTVPESYVVQKGDTLLEISRKIYGRDDRIEAICSLNGIRDSDRILAGQKLLLPQ